MHIYLWWGEDAFIFLHKVYCRKKDCLVKFHCLFDHAWKTARSIIYNVHKYFKRENVNTKYRGLLKLNFKIMKATSYREHTVRNIVAEKSKGQATFHVIGQTLKVDRMDEFNMEALHQLVSNFYQEKFRARSHIFWPPRCVSGTFNAFITREALLVPWQMHLCGCQLYNWNK